MGRVGEGTTAAPVLRAGRTLLRRFGPADAPAFAAINRDPENVEWAGSDATMDDAGALRLINGPVAEGWAHGNVLRFAVVELADGDAAGRVVGTVSLQDVSRTDTGGAASVGVKLLADGRGRGHATRAVTLLCDFAFGELGLDALHWRTTVGNEASRALAERCGFTLAATIPGYGHRAGRTADGWMFARTRAGEALAPEPCVPRLVGKGVVLRALSDADAEQLVVNCRDADAVRWTTVPLDYTPEHAKHFIRVITVEGWRSGGTLTFAVADAATDALLGTVDLHGNRPGTAEVGINMGPAARGTGAAEEAVRLLADYGFNQLNLGFLHWDAMVPNWPSRKLAWKLGFRLEAQIRGGMDDRGTPREKWTLTLAAGDPRTPQEPWTGPAAPTR